jgi:hypothetical protein
MTPFPWKGKGFYGLAPMVCHPTPLKSVSILAERWSALLCSSEWHTLDNTGVFLPMALRHGTRTLFSWECAMKLVIYSLTGGEKRKCPPHPCALQGLTSQLSPFEGESLPGSMVKGRKAIERREALRPSWKKAGSVQTRR